MSAMPPSMAAASGARRRFSLILAVPAVIVLALFGFGMARLVLYALADGGRSMSEVLARPDYLRTLWNTHYLAAIVTCVCVVLGYPVAAFIDRQSRWKTFCLLLVIFPWLVSVVVRTFGWIVLLGPNGFLNNLLIWVGIIERPLRMMFNFTGVVIGMVHVLLPFMIISILAVFGQLSRSLPEAAMSLGARPATIFFRVTLPLTVHGVISGAIIVYLGCMGAVVTPLLLGGLKEKMIGTQIYTDMFLFFDFGKSSALALLLLVTSCAVVIPLLLLQRVLVTRMSEKGGAGE